MNQKLARYELSKTIRRPAFILALLIAVAVAIAAALEPWANLEKERHNLLSFGYGVGVQAENYLGQTRESSFGNWIVVSANAPLSASVFFYALPLLAMLAGSWSCLFERLSGYDMQICTRVCFPLRVYSDCHSSARQFPDRLDAFSCVSSSGR